MAYALGLCTQQYPNAGALIAFSSGPNFIELDTEHMCLFSK